MDLGIPASTVMGWLCNPAQQVVTLDVLSMKEQELQREVLLLRQRIRKLLALLRLLVVLLRISGFTLANERVPGEKPRLQCGHLLTKLKDFRAEVVAGTKESAEAGEQANEKWHHGLGYMAQGSITTLALTA
jgi:hypothetical protein